MTHAELSYLDHAAGPIVVASASVGHEHRSSALDGEAEQCAALQRRTHGNDDPESAGLHSATSASNE